MISFHRAPSAAGVIPPPLRSQNRHLFSLLRALAHLSQALCRCRCLHTRLSVSLLLVQAVSWLLTGRSMNGFGWPACLLLWRLTLPQVTPVAALRGFSACCIPLLLDFLLGVVLLRSQGSKLEDLGSLLRSEGVSAYARSGPIVERRDVPRAQGLGLVCAIFCTRISPTSCRNAPLHRCGSPMRFGRPQVGWPSLVSSTSSSTFLLSPS